MASRYWVNADADNNGNNPNNWSASDGGAGGAGVPTSSDDAFFTASVVSNCTLSANFSCLALSISGYTGTFDTNDFNLTVNGDFTHSSGTWLGGAGTHTFHGFLQRTSTGAFTRETSTVVAAGTSKVFNYAATFNNLTITGSYTGSNNFGAITVNGAFNVQGSWTNNNQGISEIISPATMQVSGTLAGTSEIVVRGSQLTSFTGTITCPIQFRANLTTPVTIPAGTYAALRVGVGGSVTAVFRFASGTTSFTDLTTLTWFGTPTGLTIDGATNNPNLTITGDITIHNAFVTWNKGTGTITLSGTADQDINLLSESIEDLTINKTAGTVTLLNSFTTDGLTFTDGTLDIDGNDITVSGGMTVAAGCVAQDTTTGGLISVGGNFAINGASGNLVTWNGPDLDITGTAAADYASVTNSDASAGTQVTATNSTDNGGNTNWSFGSSAPSLVQLERGIRGLNRGLNLMAY